MSWFFDAPGGLQDFSDPSNWHDAMAQEARGIVTILAAAALEKESSDLTEAELLRVAPDLGYVDPLLTPPVGSGETVPVAPWSGFPRAVRRRDFGREFPPVLGDLNGIHRAAEHLGDEDHVPGVFVDFDGNRLNLPVRDRQDEYLEWKSECDAEGRLTRITFVAEGYDYFARLFEHDEKHCVELFREFTKQNGLTADDLRAPQGIRRLAANGSVRTVAERGVFDPRNRPNIEPGIVHLSHRANSLGAEVNLAGVSGILRSKADGSTLAGSHPEQLLCCCEGGNPNRNSDPLIAQQAYAQVAGGFRYTLANPVGLYIAGVDHDNLLTPDGETLPREWWTEERGSGFDDLATSRVLRLSLAPPPGEKLTLSDLTAKGDEVRFAGQIADIVLVHLFVTRWRRDDDSLGPMIPCSATCCIRVGTEELALSDGTCDDGLDLRFPGLVAPPMLGVAPKPRPATGGRAEAARHYR